MKLICINIWAGNLRKPLLDFIKDQASTTDIFCFQEVFNGKLAPLHAFKNADKNIYSYNLHGKKSHTKNSKNSL